MLLDELADGEAGLEPGQGPAGARGGRAHPAAHDAAGPPPVEVAHALEVPRAPARRVLGRRAPRPAAVLAALLRALLHPQWHHRAARPPPVCLL